MVLPDFLLGLLFNPEDGSSIVLQNIGGLLPDYLAVHSRGQYLFNKKNFENVHQISKHIN
jgi:hypothetical protein